MPPGVWRVVVVAVLMGRRSMGPVVVDETSSRSWRRWGTLRFMSP